MDRLKRAIQILENELEFASTQTEKEIIKTKLSKLYEADQIVFYVCE